MKKLSFAFTVIILFAAYAYCQETSLSAIKQIFEVPKGWQMVNSSTYILKDFEKTVNYWEKELSFGHQPWRLEPANVAAACLLDFGIRNGSVIDDFAARLTVIEYGKIYSLKVNQQTFMVYIKTKKKIPIAYKLEIKK
jgi:hypothetical protein